MHLFLVFSDKAMPDYEPVKDAIVKGIEKLITIVKAAQPNA